MNRVLLKCAGILIAALSLFLHLDLCFSPKTPEFTALCIAGIVGDVLLCIGIFHVSVFLNCIRA